MGNEVEGSLAKNENKFLNNNSRRLPAVFLFFICHTPVEEEWRTRVRLVVMADLRLPLLKKRIIPEGVSN